MIELPNHLSREIVPLRCVKGYLHAAIGGQGTLAKAGKTRRDHTPSDVERHELETRVSWKDLKPISMKLIGVVEYRFRSASRCSTPSAGGELGLHSLALPTAPSCPTLSGAGCAQEYVIPCGQLLSRASQKSFVICITHLPPSHRLFASCRSSA